MEDFRGYPITEVLSDMELNPWRFNNKRDDPMNLPEIEIIESRLSYKLNDCYKYHLMNFGAGEFGSGEIWTPIESSEWSIVSLKSFLPADLQKKFLPFSDSNRDLEPNLDMYMFELGNESNSDVVGYDILNQMIIETAVRTFSQFIIKECLY